VVNASLNWASIVGIVLAVGGALLYFMRSFKPALARDYDVFFAAIGLLCGGILFFQGWRLDPILQFGQFLLAGTTVFFAYESVRLRGVTTEQARRSSYFDEDEPLPTPGPYRPRMGGRPWDGAEADRLDEPQPLRRRIPSRGEDDDSEDFYRPRRASRAAIPERAVSRRESSGDWDRGDQERPASVRRYSAGRETGNTEFGSRRRDRDGQPEARRGTRPVASNDTLPRSSRRGAVASGRTPSQSGAGRAGVPEGTPIRRSRGDDNSGVSDADFTPLRPRPPARPANPPQDGAGGTPPSRARDNSSRFDD
jgi:hypothetical protein